MTFLQESTIFLASSEVPTRSAPPVAPPVTPVRSAPKSTADSTAPAATVQLSGKKASTAAQYSRQYSIEYRDRLSRLKSRKRVGHLSLWDKYLQARSSQVQSAAPKCPSAPTKSAGPASAPKVGRASTGPIAGRSWAEFGGSSWPLKKNPPKISSLLRNIRGGWAKFIGLRGGQPKSKSKSSSSRPAAPKSSSSGPPSESSRSSILSTAVTICSKCVSSLSQHKCKVCNYIRCKQFHLEARDDGAYFVCQGCDPDVRGLERLETPDGIMPDLDDDHPARQSALSGRTSSPSVPFAPSSDAECNFCIDSDDQCEHCGLVRCRMFHLGSKDDGSSFVCQDCDPTAQGILSSAGGAPPGRMPGAKAAPTAGPSNPAPSVSPPPKKLKTPSKESDGGTEPTPRSRPSVIVYTPSRSSQVSGLRPTVEVFQGNPNTPDCIYVGPPGPQKWDKSNLVNYYFIVPSQDKVKVLTMRAGKDARFTDMIKGIKEHYTLKYNLHLEDPNFWVKGRKILHHELLFSHAPKTLILITEGASLPQHLLTHKGALRECTLCGKSWHFSNRAPKGCDHQILFDNQIGKSAGNNLDRKEQPKPWGCPVGHVGLGEELPEHQPSVVQPPRTPKPSKSPAKPATPRSHVRRRLEISEPAPQPAARPAPQPSYRPPSPDSPQPKRQRAAKEVGSNRTSQLLTVQHDSDTPDISGSDTEDEFRLDAESSERSSGDESSNDEEVGASRNNEADDVDEDDEVDEDEEVYEDFLSDELMDEIYERLLEEAVVPDRVYEPDDEDDEWMRKQIIAPQLESSQLMKKFGSQAPEEVLQLMKAGRRPDRHSGISSALFSSTATVYSLGLKDLLGLYQESLIQAGMGYRLIDGKIKLRQFFAFKQPHHLNLPEEVETLVEQLPTGNAKTFALAGFRRLVTSLQKFLRQPQGIQLFMTRNEGQEDFSERKMIDESEKERTEQMRKIRELLEYLKISDQYGKYTGQKKLDQEQKKKFNEEFLGLELPDSKAAITAYLALDSTRKMLKELETLSHNKAVVHKFKMSSISRDFMKFCSILRGVRIQCFGDAFTRGQFLSAVRRKEPASFPYVAVTGHEGLDMNDRDVRSNTYNDVDSGSRLYARPDLYAADPNDPNDPRSSDDGELLQGIAIEIEHHKTGCKYPMYLWFSQVQVMYLRMYEDIARRFSIANNFNIDPATGLPSNKSPFFISGTGAATYQQNMRPLDYTDFAKAAGIPKCTSMYFRKMFSNILLAQKDIALRECEEWTMCHAPTTAKTFYEEEFTKKLRAIKANTWYQALFTEQEQQTSTRSSSASTYTSREQAEAEAVGLLALTREQLENRIRYEDKIESARAPTKDKILTNKTRAAIVNLIGKSGTDMLDLLMTKRPVKNIACYTAVMKLISLAPRDDPDAKVIRDNLLLFANLSSGESLTPRALLYTYCTRLVASQLHNLRSLPHVDNTRLLVALGDIYKVHGEKYTFGNSGLAAQLKSWRSKELAREQSVIVPENINTVSAEIEAREQRRQQRLEELRAGPSSAPGTSTAPAPTAPAPTGPESSSDEDLESVNFTTFKDREMEVDMGGVKFTLPPGTPCKMTPVKKKKVPWTDMMKIQLLIHWMEKAADPLKRPPPTNKGKGKAVYRNDPNMNDLYNNSTITMADGTDKPLSSLCKPDYVHSQLASGQLYNQPSLGLASIIDEVMGDDERTPENLEGKKQRIIALAKTYAKSDSDSSD